MLALGRPKKDDEGRSVEAVRVDDLARFEAEALEPVIYEQFGVRLQLGRLEDAPREAFELALAECAQALSEQRERLLDMVDEQVERIVTEHCGSGGVESWDLDGLAESARKTFDIFVEDLDKHRTAEELARHLYDEVEWIIKLRDDDLGQAQVEETVELAIADCCGPPMTLADFRLDELQSRLEKDLGIDAGGQQGKDGLDVGHGGEEFFPGGAHLVSAQGQLAARLPQEGEPCLGNGAGYVDLHDLSFSMTRVRAAMSIVTLGRAS